MHMDLSKAEKILKDLKEGSKKVEGLVELVESAKLLAEQGQELFSVIESVHEILTETSEQLKDSCSDLLDSSKTIESSLSNYQKELLGQVESIGAAHEKLIVNSGDRIVNGQASVLKHLKKSHSEFTDSQKVLLDKVESIGAAHEELIVKGDESIIEGQSSILKQLENVYRELGGQLNRNTGATHQKLGDIEKLVQGLAEQGNRIAENVESNENKLKAQTKMAKFALFLLVANTVVLGIIAFYSMS